MVKFSSIDTKAERKSFTKENKDKAIIKRASGETLVVDRNTGRVTSEFSSTGQRRARVSTRGSSSGSSGGSSGFQKVDDQKAIMQQDVDVANRRISIVNARIVAENERLMREGNISLGDGRVGRVDYVFGNSSPDANISLEGGGIARVDYTFTSREPGRIRRVIDRYEGSGLQQFLEGSPQEVDITGLKAKAASGGFGSAAAQRTLNQYSRAGLDISGNTVVLSPSGSPAAIEFITPAGLVGGVSRGAKAAKAVSSADDFARLPKITKTLFNIKTPAQLTARTAQLNRLAIGTTVSLSAPIIGRDIGTITSEREFKQQVAAQGLDIRDVEKELFTAGKQAQTRGASQTKGIIIPEQVPFIGGQQANTRGIIQALPGGLLIQGKQTRGEFGTAAAIRAQELGLNPALGAQFALRQRKFRGFGEVVGVAGFNITSEIAGAGFLSSSKLFTSGVRNLSQREAAKRLFGTGFVQIGKAGFIEGAGSQVVQNIGRAEQIKPGQVLGAGAFGFATAGVLGGSVAGLAPLSPTASKGLYGVALITDPFEIVGDVGAAGLRKAGSRIPSPSISKSQSDAGKTLFGFGPSGRITQGPTFSRAPNITRTPSFTQANVFTGTFTPTTSTTSKVKGPFTFTGTFSNVGAFGNTFTNPFAGLTNTKTSTNIPSAVGTPTFTGVPTTIPLARLPPPLIPPGILTGGRGQSGGKKGRKYVKELDIGLEVIKRFTGKGTRGGFF